MTELPRIYDLMLLLSTTAEDEERTRIRQIPRSRRRSKRPVASWSATTTGAGAR